MGQEESKPEIVKSVWSEFAIGEAEIQIEIFCLIMTHV